MKVKSILLIALLAFVGAVLAGDKLPNGYTAFQWVDEHGVEHLTFVSPRLDEGIIAEQENTEKAGPRVRIINDPKVKPPIALTGKKQIRSAKVHKIIDGNTLLLSSGQKLKFIGIKAPGVNEPGGKRAVRVLKKMIEKKHVNILYDFKKFDDQGNLLGFVFLRKLTFVNAELVRKGYAEKYTVPPNTQYSLLFKNLEKRAKARKLGIWKK